MVNSFSRGHIFVPLILNVTENKKFVVIRRDDSKYNFSSSVRKNMEGFCKNWLQKNCVHIITTGCLKSNSVVVLKTSLSKKMASCHIKYLLNGIKIEREKEKERSTFFNSVLSGSMQLAGFISCFWKVCTGHHAPLCCQWHDLPFSTQSDRYVLLLVFSTSYLVTTPSSSHHFKIQCSS